MKLLRFGESGAEKPGAIDADGRIRDLAYRRFRQVFVAALRSVTSEK